MKKKLLTLLLALAMMVSVVPGASAAGTLPQDDISTIRRNPNRYYNVTEYSDYYGPVDFVVEPDDAASNLKFKNAIAGAMKTVTKYAVKTYVPEVISSTIITAAANEIIDAFTTFVYYENYPYARAGHYTVSAKIKTKYRVDSLDPSHKVKVDQWVVYDVYHQESGSTSTHTSHLK